jgi:hypothetical protein
VEAGPTAQDRKDEEINSSSARASQTNEKTRDILITEKEEMKMQNPEHEFQIMFARIHESDPLYGLPVTCNACGAPHAAVGFARITPGPPYDIPVCGPCVEATDHSTEPVDAIAQRYFRGPELEIERNPKIKRDIAEH